MQARRDEGAYPQRSVTNLPFAASFEIDGRRKPSLEAIQNHRTEKTDNHPSVS